MLDEMLNGDKHDPVTQRRALIIRSDDPEKDIADHSPIATEKWHRDLTDPIRRPKEVASPIADLSYGHAPKMGCV